MNQIEFNSTVERLKLIKHELETILKIESNVQTNLIQFEIELNHVIISATKHMNRNENIDKLLQDWSIFVKKNILTDIQLKEFDTRYDNLMTIFNQK